MKVTPSPKKCQESYSEISESESDSEEKQDGDSGGIL